MGSSAFQHTDYRHIFLKKYAGALSVTGRAVKKRTGRERTGEKLFPSEKNTEFSFDFLSVLQGVTFFAGIFGIIFPVQKLTGIFPVNGSVIAGTHLCPRDRVIRTTGELAKARHTSLPAGQGDASGLPPGKTSGKDTSPEEGEARHPRALPEAGNRAAWQLRGIRPAPSASAGHRIPGKSTRDPVPHGMPAEKKRNGRDPAEDHGRFAVSEKEPS